LVRVVVRAGGVAAAHAVGFRGVGHGRALAGRTSLDLASVGHWSAPRPAEFPRVVDKRLSFQGKPGAARPQPRRSPAPAKTCGTTERPLPPRRMPLDHWLWLGIVFGFAGLRGWARLGARQDHHLQ
jgi:hypothetical protein